MYNTTTNKRSLLKNQLTNFCVKKRPTHVPQKKSKACKKLYSTL